MSFISTRNVMWHFYRGDLLGDGGFRQHARRLDGCRFSRLSSHARGSGDTAHRRLMRWMDATRFCRRCGLMFMQAAGGCGDLCPEHALMTRG
jgi:hypothetical protein